MQLPLEGLVARHPAERPRWCLRCARAALALLEESAVTAVAVEVAVAAAAVVEAPYREDVGGTTLGSPVLNTLAALQL